MSRRSIKGVSRRQLPPHAPEEDPPPHGEINPYIHFMMSEAWAGLAGIVVYGLFRGGAYLAYKITEALPLHDPEPAKFLEALLSWGAAISAGATFCVISMYQLAILLKRLYRDIAI